MFFVLQRSLEWRGPQDAASVELACDERYSTSFTIVPRDTVTVAQRVSVRVCGSVSLRPALSCSRLGTRRIWLVWRRHARSLCLDRARASHRPWRLVNIPRPAYLICPSPVLSPWGARC